METLLIIGFFLAIIGTWRFTAKKLHAKHWLFRHLAGLVAGSIIPFLITGLGIQSGQTGQAIALVLLILCTALGFKRISNKPKATLEKTPDTQKSIDDEIKKLRNIGQNSKSPYISETEQSRSDVKTNKLQPSSIKNGHKSKTRLHKIDINPLGGSQASSKSKSQSTDLTKGDYLIHYVDSKGDRSQRNVSNLRRKGSNITGFCHMRNQVRTFKVDRVQEPIVCLDSGEVLEKKEWLKAI